MNSVRKNFKSSTYMSTKTMMAIDDAEMAFDIAKINAFSATLVTIVTVALFAATAVNSAPSVALFSVITIVFSLGLWIALIFTKSSAHHKLTEAKILYLQDQGDQIMMQMQMNKYRS